MTHIEKVGVLDVLYTVAGGGVLKVSQRMTADESFQNLSTLLNAKDFIHLQDGVFQYIDLRFGDKIFLNEEEVIVDQKDENDIATSTEEVAE